MLIEDNAHGFLGSYRGRPLGTFGDLAALSFHQTKNITCGEGGALVVNAPGLLERAEVVREKGTDRKRFLMGEVDRYTWQDLGSSYVLSDLLASVLCSQLKLKDEVQRRRRSVWERYDTELIAWAASRGVQLPVVPADCEQSYHLFYLLMPEMRQRDALIGHLGRRGVESTFHFQPLHLSPMGRRAGGRAGQLPVTESACSRLIRLPFYTDLAAEDQDRVIEAVLDFEP
jgi:dTDP-4-amino-4,6-dideoxygalactose transaminase